MRKSSIIIKYYKIYIIAPGKGNFSEFVKYMQAEKLANQSILHNMVPHAMDDHDEFVTGDEGEGEVKEEKLDDCISMVRKFPKLPKFPKLQSHDQLPQFLLLAETILFQDGYSEAALDLLRVKMEIISSFVDCEELYRTATLLIGRPWVELKRHLLHSFAGTARMRAEANTKLAQLKFDRDLMANRIRSLYDWFSLHDSAMSSHEFVSRVFTTKIFPVRYLERVIERAEQRFPQVNWRRVPIWDLCDIVEEVCLLMSELEAVNPNQKASDNVRRVATSGSWLESWVKDFAKVYYIADAGVASQLGERADDSRKLFSKKQSRSYFLVAFKKDKAASDAVKDLDPSSFREFKLRKPLNSGRAE